ncbi:bifunctional 3,4-dihydroxy-2-butanone-4-phosphate synthase/GTP cyclohydrolase II [Shimazuella sp. AN120528]|uniref:bifunctional 3,4-dihydroxy-2-butanone-4-phosphate synthase/GTP cyclohydrolase II n=1 Tax=Shimazuella soli TaxID=1892854 RepID=UPI001F10EAE3|nr:bifunctional 3,4-dihydroxy-2-butanone-4-phosphate synthase/GTP cyclohydrolase II [Shimazuella soli]MCH5584274.1 bifunctional 3,4-dihydroxy-2-butanone-4-phosphate synthase/GTP cyclohydrolase II [Shimazuella soli]
MFHTVEEALEDLRAGRMVIVVDAQDRENEGDLICLADQVTPEIINFMVTHGRGLVCASISKERAEELELTPMVASNTERHGTAFTVSVDADDVTTGISAAERATTIRALCDPTKKAFHFRRPGHIFPLIANPEGVLGRAGHTEAALDLARLAGGTPAGVICEVLNEDGSMARLPQLATFSQKHQLKMISIQDLIQYRRSSEPLVERVVSIQLPTDYGDFKMVGYSNTVDNKEHVAIVKGEINPDEPILVRIHSECLTGDVFGSKRCDCGPQLHAALHQIEEAGSGIILYMRQEGRGIGLLNKLLAYKLQEEGYDTVEANLRLGFADDLRTYDLCAQMLKDLQATKIKLITNNPRKIKGLDEHGIEIVETVPIQLPTGEHNKRYMETKKEKLGHLLHL